ncbi:unnamed protein product [Urochloa humidicola]
MAKLGSGDILGPRQGMLLPVLLLLLLASVQAVPIMASLEELVEQFTVRAGEKGVVAGLGKIKGWEKTSKDVKAGFRTCKMLRKVQGLIAHWQQQQNPGAVDTIGTIPTSQSQSMLVPPVSTAEPGTRNFFCGLDMVLGRVRVQPYPIDMLRARGRGTAVVVDRPAWGVVSFGRGSGLARSNPTIAYRVGGPHGTTAVWVPPATTTSPSQQLQAGAPTSRIGLEPTSRHY